VNPILERIRRSNRLKLCAILSPPLIFLIIFFFFPFTFVFIYSLGMVDYYGNFVFKITLKYYSSFIQLKGITTIFMRTIYIATVTTVLCLILGYPVAYTIATKASERYKHTLMMLVIVPFWVSFLLRTYAIMLLLKPDGLLTNMINTVLLKLGIIKEPMMLLYTMKGVLIGMVYDYLPFMILPLYTSIEKLDKSLLEASYTLGANPIRTFINVTLPLTLPGIIAGSLLVFVPAIGEFVIPALLGGTESYLIGNLIWTYFLSGRNWWIGSAISTVFILFVLAVTLIYIKFMAKGGGIEF